MLFFKVLELLLIFFLGLLVITQIVIPAFKKRAMFPLFRNQGKLEAEEAELNQQKVEKEMQKAIDKLKEEINNGDK